MTAPSPSSLEEELARLRSQIDTLEQQAKGTEKLSRALQESRGLFDAFLSHLPLFAWVTDSEGRFVYVNRRMQRYLESLNLDWVGLKAERLLQVPAQPVSPSNLAGQTARVREFVIQKSNGDQSWSVRQFPFTSTAGKKYNAAIAADVTERARLEALLRGREQAEQSAKAQAVSILESLRKSESRGQTMFHSELFGMMECQGEFVVDINDTLLCWIGLSRDEFLKRPRKWAEFTAERFRGLEEDCVAKLRDGGRSCQFEKELNTQDGRTMPVTVHISALDDSGECFLATILDQSDARDMQDRLLRSQKLESLGLIAGGVAHDFNNLLATIMGNASMSLDALTPEHPAYHSLREVLIASRRASELTQQMLAYSGRANFSIQTLDLSQMVLEIGSLLETTISKKLNLTYALAENLPGLEGDAGQVQQIIMNLVINSSDAIGERAGEIHVSTYHLGQPGSGFVCFEVSDTGCGMSEETRERIFDPFFTTKANGRGLGLAAVMNVVKNHGGKMTVESTPGKGTTFRVFFPESHRQKFTRRERVNPQLWGSETILVVDDDEGIRRMTKASLERFGYRVLIANDGADAVSAYSKHQSEIAIVLLDWAMPVMNGEEALRQILKANPEAKVLLSSGYAETETMQRIGTGALAGFLQKPYTTTQLAARLREILGPSEVAAAS